MPMFIIFFLTTFSLMHGSLKPMDPGKSFSEYELEYHDRWSEGAIVSIIQRDSAHGLELVVAKQSGLIEIWGKENIFKGFGRCLFTLAFPHEVFCSIIAMPEHFLLSGSDSGKIRLWNLASQACTRTFCDGESVVFALAMIDEKTFVAGADDGSIVMWNLDVDCPLKRFLGHTGAVRAFVVLPDKRLISASCDGTIKCWDLETGECEQTLVGHTGPVVSIILLRDRSLCSASLDGHIKMWDINLGDCLQTIQTHDNALFSIMQLDDERLVSCGEDYHLDAYGSIKFFDPQSGKLLKKKSIRSVAFSCIQLKNKKLVFGLTNGMLTLWGPQNKS